MFRRRRHERPAEPIPLPLGRDIVPDPSFAPSAPSERVGWVTLEAVPDVGPLWSQQAAQFTRTGRWPLVLSSLDDDDARPWLSGEVHPGLSSDPGAVSVADVLAEWWGASIEEDEDDDDAEFANEDLAPFGREFPGLAPPTPGPDDDGAPARVAARMQGRLGMVQASRPADCVAVLGWVGPANFNEDMGRLAAVLRSWEDRFGAVLVGLGFDTLTLAVRRPPRDEPHALAVAAEHLAACPDNVFQGPGALSEYASGLVGADQWDFWWD